MCGIFGYSGIVDANNSGQLHKFISYLAYESESRGTHSAGFAARYDSGFLVADKMPYRGSVFLANSGVFSAMKNNMPNSFIGHTRYGTGSNPRINNNNHPFFGDAFHMVHNGVIPSWKDLAIRYGVLNKMSSETDSEIVLRIIEDRLASGTSKSPRHAIEWVLNNVWGNMAIALLSKRSPKILLFRNENPIALYTIKNGVFGGRFYFFASTKKIFEDAWSGAFKRKLDDCLEEVQLLSDNKLFNISTEGTKINNQYETFTVSDLKVDRPFKTQAQYYHAPSIAGASTVSKDLVVVSSTVEYYSEIIDAKRPELGCRFSHEDINSMRTLLAEDSNVSRVRMDGFTVSEYSMLSKLRKDLKKMYSSANVGLETTMSAPSISV